MNYSGYNIIHYIVIFFTIFFDIIYKENAQVKYLEELLKLNNPNSVDYLKNKA